MESKWEKRIWSRIISFLLILCIMGEECLGNGVIVLAAEVDHTVETEITDEKDQKTEEEPTVNSGEINQEPLIPEGSIESPDQSPGDEELGQIPGESQEQDNPLDEGEKPEEEQTEEQEEAQEEEPEEESDFLAEDEPQTVLVAGEDITMRSSNVKYFLNEDHSYTAALYPEPIHYEENGEWKEIDNQLEEAEPEEGTDFLQNKQNPFKVKFSKKSNGKKLVNIKMDEFQISWGLKNSQKVDAVSNNGKSNFTSMPTYEEDSAVEDSEPEEQATIFTESPEAAQAGDGSVEEVEEKFGSTLKAAPENNTEKGVLPEEQVTWQDTDKEEEETLDDSYFNKIQQANQEKMKVEGLASGVVYKEILPKVDVEYILDSQKLKENIILKSPDAQNEFTFQFQVHGMNPVKQEERILFQDGDGRTIFELQPPFVYDAEGKYADCVTLDLVQGKGKKCEIEVTVDREWLDKEGRKFPVVVDPVVETSKDANSIQDAYALSGYPATNYYARPILKTGVNGSDGAARSFLRFALPQLKSGDMVVDAKLNLYCYSTSSSPTTVGAYEVMDTTWTSQSVTWQTQPVHADDADDYVVFTPKNGNSVTFTITKMAKKWYEEGVSSGVMIRAAQEDGQYTEYVSSDFPIESKDARPSVLITYISNSGLEDYWTYHEQNVGRAGTGYVNDCNGNLIFVYKTAATNGSRMPITLSHVYNTNDKDVNLGYGYGWRLNYLQTIKQTKISGTDYYEYVDEDGTYHYFYYDKEKSQWKDESGIDLSLEINGSSADRYMVKDKQDNKLIFDANGKLIKITDQNGNTLTVTYSGSKIASIADGVGRKVICSYDANGLLSTVTDPSGKVKRFTYRNSLLTQITDTDQKTITYTYHGSRAMAAAASIDGYKVQYTYSEQAPYRVRKVSESAGSTAGQSFEVWRYDNQSRFTDHKGRQEIYLFNNSGNTISVKNDKGYAQSTKYLTEGKNKNKLSKVSKLQAPAVNLLSNPYLESATGWAEVLNQGTAVRESDSANALEGNYVLHTSSSGTSGIAAYKQQVTLEAGKTYTFSVYAKTAEENLKQGKCLTQIQVITSSNKTLNSEKWAYYETKDGWYRLSASLTVPDGVVVTAACVLAGTKGTAEARFDCFQLEEAVSASRYNLIENGDFRRGTAGFTMSGGNIYDRVIDNASEPQDMAVRYRRGTVTEPVLNMRSGPGTNYGIVTTATKGTYVTAIGEGRDSGGVTWYYTYVIKDKQVYSGYMISSYINFSSGYSMTARKSVVDVANLNVRKGPGTGYGILATIPRNAVVQAVDSASTFNGQIWDLIYFNSNGTNYIGYVLGEYLYTGLSGATYDRTAIDTLDAHVFHMTGNPAFVKKLTQTLNIRGKAGDVYMGNVWGTGFPAALKDSRTHGLEVEFVAADGSKESYVSNFKANTMVWQFLNDVFIAKKDYIKINVSCIYNYNCNTVAFDGLALFREDFSESYTYDSEGNVVSVVDNAKKQNSFEYDGNNNLKKLVDAKGKSFQYTYDTSHNVTSAVSAENVKYTFQYDSYGNPTDTKIVNPGNESEFIQSSAAYTSDGNYQKSVTDPLGNTVQNDYDLTKGTLKSSKDALEYTTSYSYDSMDRLTKVEKGVSGGFTSGNAEVEYSYENDSLKRISHNGYVYIFQEDGFGNSTGVQAAGRQLVSRTYEANNGNLASEQYANGYTYLYIYDGLDRVKEVRLKDPENREYVLYRYAYDREGNLAAEYDIRQDIGRETIVTRYYYDISGRLAYLRNDQDEDYRFAYDLNDNLTKTVQKNKFREQGTEYTYDKDNRETSTKTAAKTFMTVYDALGRTKSRTWNTAAPYTTEYIYQDGVNGSKSTQVQKVKNGNGETTYQYDKNGNIISETTTAGTIHYAYDELNQLVREDNSITGKTIGYVYDLGGNLKEKCVYSYLPGKSIEELSQTQPEKTTVYGYDSQWKDLLVSYNGTEITYDGMGNPLQYHGMTLSWKNQNELTNVVKGENIYTYRYNKDGVRNRKYLADGTVMYQLQGNTVVGEQKVNNTTGAAVYELEYLYDSVGNILSMIYNGVEYYYVKNLQGDIIGIIDGQGTEVVTYRYDSWGKLLQIGGNQELGAMNPFRYRGYYYDSETGLYYVSSRYYDPETCRFISADDTAILAVEQGSLNQYNLYAYCLNNPVNRIDVDGHLSLPNWAKVTIGAVATVAAVGLTVVTGGAALPVLAGVATSTLSGTAIGYVTGGKKGAINGAADGFMWGGIGALASSVVGAVKTVKSYKKIVNTYSSLKKQYKGSGKEIHHVIEQRLAKPYNVNTNKMPSIALSKSTHRIYTNNWRKQIAYGSGKVSKWTIYKASKAVYKGNRVLKYASIVSLRSF